MTIYQLLSNRPEVRVSNSLVFKWKFLQSIHIPVLYRSDTDIRQLGTGYNAVKWQDGVMTGQSTIDAGGGASFSVTCQWVVDGNILTLNRMLSVRGNQRGAGFYSAIRLYTAPELTWPDVSFLAPGLLYGDPSHDGMRSPGGTMFDERRRFTNYPYVCCTTSATTTQY
jgi:hypothetical protein